MNRATVRPRSNHSRMGGPEEDDSTGHDQPVMLTSSARRWSHPPNNFPSPLVRSDHFSIAPSSPYSASSGNLRDYEGQRDSYRYGIGIIYEEDEKEKLKLTKMEYDGTKGSEDVELRDYATSYLNSKQSYTMRDADDGEPFSSPVEAASPNMTSRTTSHSMAATLSTTSSSASSLSTPGAYAIGQSLDTRMTDESLSPISETGNDDDDNEQREAQSNEAFTRAPSNVNISAEESRLSLLTDGSPLVTAMVVAERSSSGSDRGNTVHNTDDYPKAPIPCGVLQRDKRVRCFLCFNALLTLGLLAGVLYMGIEGSPGIIDKADQAGGAGGSSIVPTVPPTAAPVTASPTSSPTSAPTMMIQLLRNRLETYAGEPNVVTALDDPSSPQSEALHWIEQDPSALQYQPYRLAQRFALASLQFETKRYAAPEDDDEGDGNPTQQRKLDSTELLAAFDVFDETLYASNECDWGGNTTIVCDENNRISQMDVSMRNMRGTLPPELALLTELEWFSGYGNRLFGTLPSVYSRFKKLNGYDVQGNDFGGPFDATLWKMASLKYLHVGNNQYSGSLTSDIGQLSNLVSIKLSNLNNFGGPIPDEFYSLTKLTTIDMYDTGFSGTISTRIRRLSLLQELLLGNNNFSGTVPAELGRLTDCWSLDLYKNQLTGTIPSQIGRLTYLGSLDLSSNELTGTIPSELFQMTSNDGIWWFGLAKNQLNGTLPTQIGRLIKAYGELELDNNMLTGTIPTELGRLTMLTSYLRLDNNHFTGPLPTQLGQLTMLTQLRLSNNPDVTGTVPSELGLLTGLSTPLDFTNIGFDGGSTVPNEICALVLGNLTEEEMRVCECVANISVNCNVVCSCCTETCFL